MALSRTKRKDVEEMMEELELEAPAGMAALLAELPAELVNMVEDVADDQLELHFHLGGLHSLTKLALGVEGTETVIVTLRIFGGGVVDAFCVHLEQTVGTPTMSHKWMEIGEVKAPPTWFKCHGKQTRLAYAVARAVWRELKDHELDLAGLYAHVKDVIQNGANAYLYCGKDIGARLHRTTSCGSMVCNLTASEGDWGVLTEILRLDHRAMDLLFTALHAAASTGNMELLPDFRKMWPDSTKLLAALHALPSTDTLAKATGKRIALRSFGKYVDVLAPAVCHVSRNFIISATGHWRIPNMPKIHQFLVVDNPPEVEAAFAKHNHIQPRMVLFHGTSMDRLYAILSQGLRVLSNTPLMKHGAASGAGIYFSTETSLPASYAAITSPAVAGHSAFFHSRKDFDGPQVLLGCEHAGPAKKGGIFVVTDPTKVIVRYIFLVPKGVAFPVAKDIIAPMVSTFYSLRASAATSK